MDPKACLQLAADQLADGDKTEAAESLENYFTWRMGGGFEPAGGDAAALYLLHALAGGAVAADDIAEAMRGVGEAEPDAALADELIIPLVSGTLRCGSRPSVEGRSYGDYVRICDPAGNEMVYWDSAEWEEAPEIVMGAIFGAALKGGRK